MNDAWNLPARILAVLSIVVGMAIAAPAAAQAAETVLSVTPYTQEKSNWCWAAAAKMIIRHQTGRVVAQCTIVKQAKGTAACNNVTGTNTNVWNVLNRNGVNGGTHRRLDWDTVGAEMRLSRPVYSRIAWRSGGGHAHVIRGYYSTGYSSGVSYIDPLSGTSTSREWSFYVSNSEWTMGNGLIHLYKK